MYEVLRYFTDLQDDGYPYKTGDSFPREGLNVSDDRLAQLSSNDNLRGYPLIKKVLTESLNPVSPVQSEMAEQDTPSEKEAQAKAEVKPEKPKRGRKKTKE